MVSLKIKDGVQPLPYFQGKTNDRYWYEIKAHRDFASWNQETQDRSSSGLLPMCLDAPVINQQREGEIRFSKSYQIKIHPYIYSVDLCLDWSASQAQDMQVLEGPSQECHAHVSAKTDGNSW